MSWLNSMRSRPGCFRTPHGADLSACPAAAVEQVCSVGFKPADGGAARHLQSFEYGTVFWVDAADIALVSFPCSMPEFTINPGYAGDETVGLDGAENGAGVWVDLVDSAVAVLAYPQA